MERRGEENAWNDPLYHKKNNNIYGVCLFLFALSFLSCTWIKILPVHIIKKVKNWRRIQIRKNS
jgi:hypothetical protein